MEEKEKILREGLSLRELYLVQSQWVRPSRTVRECSLGVAALLLPHLTPTPAPPCQSQRQEERAQVREKWVDRFGPTGVSTTEGNILSCVRVDPFPSEAGLHSPRKELCVLHRSAGLTYLCGGVVMGSWALCEGICPS